MNNEIKAYHEKLSAHDQEICELLATTIDNELTEAESKIWHAHPVGFWTAIRRWVTANRKKE